MQKDLSVIIVNWNAGDFIINCIKSIYDNTKNITFEVIVVDNNSSDSSCEHIKSKFADVILIENKNNLGFARANNHGIKQSSGRCILLLNPDTVVLLDSLEKMVELMDNNKDVGGLGCKILNPDLTTHRYFRKDPSLSKEILKLILPERFSLEEKRTKPGEYKNEREVQVLSGCCMMVKREVFDKIGLLDEDFFMYGEDVELCQRIRKSSWKIHYTPYAKIIHYGKKSTEQIRTQMSIEGLKSTFKLLKKNSGSFNAMLYRLAIFITSILKIIIYSSLFVLSLKKQVFGKKVEWHLSVIKALTY